MDHNMTFATEIILLGFYQDLSTSIVLFIVFFVIHLVTVIGNLSLILVVILTSHLQIPMYFFLCILSFLDLGNSSSVVPRLLWDLFSIHRSISVGACAVQLYMILLMSGSECLLLAIMAYDRYVAICRPLHYSRLMSWSICYRLIGTLGVLSFFMFVLPTLAMPVPLCYPNTINHFMCEVLAVRKITCIQSYFAEVLILSICVTSVFSPFIVILISYTCIISSVLKIQTTDRSKAFSTCTSHIAVVVLFYGSEMAMYFGASANYSTNQGKYIAVFCNIICPMLNPLIYSLNNKDIKTELKKCRHICIPTNYHSQS